MPKVIDTHAHLGECCVFGLYGTEEDMIRRMESDAVEKLMSVQLRMENAEPNGFRCYRLSYRPAGSRQIDIERWQTPEEIAVVAAEVLEAVENEGHPAAARIRVHLGQTVDIVDASFGFSPGEQMAPVLASEAMRWLAEKFDGIIRADDAWWELGPQHHEYRKLRP